MKTMDEKGDNTFPSHNLPPNSRNNLKGLSCDFSPFLLDKRKSVATLANLTIMVKGKRLESVLPPYHKTGDSLCGVLT